MLCFLWLVPSGLIDVFSLVQCKPCIEQRHLLSLVSQRVEVERCYLSKMNILFLEVLLAAGPSGLPHEQCRICFQNPTNCYPSLKRKNVWYSKNKEETTKNPKERT